MKKLTKRSIVGMGLAVCLIAGAALAAIQPEIEQGGVAVVDYQSMSRWPRHFPYVWAIYWVNRKGQVVGPLATNGNPKGWAVRGMKNYYGSGNGGAIVDVPLNAAVNQPTLNRYLVRKRIPNSPGKFYGDGTFVVKAKP